MGAKMLRRSSLRTKSDENVIFVPRAKNRQLYSF